MTSVSYPAPGYNGGAVTDLEFERLVSSQAADGVIGTPSAAPMVFADGSGTRVVRIRVNRRALVRGFMYDSGPNELTLTLAANTSGVTRVDLIVLRLDRATWTVFEGVVQGTPGAGAPAPSQNTGSIGVWDLPLAQVTVINGATSLSAGTVVPLAWYVGDDGQILCTPSTRPPGNAGRQIHEIDTDVTWESTGVNEPWRVLGNMVAVNSRAERDNFGGKYDGLAFWRRDLDRLDVFTGSGWRILASRPTVAVTPGFEGTPSANYTDLATHGPQVTVEHDDAVEVTLSAQMIGQSPVGFVLMSFQVTGAANIAPSDSLALNTNYPGWTRAGITHLVTGLTPGVSTFKAKYRVQFPNSGGAWDWRTIAVRPV